MKQLEQGSRNVEKSAVFRSLILRRSCTKKSTVSSYENDKIDIKSSVVTELSKLLDTDPNYLLGAESADNDFVKEIGHYD